MKAKMDLENKGMLLRLNIFLLCQWFFIQSVTLFHNLLYLLLKALQERLDREAAGLKAKLSEADERTAKVGSGYTQQKQYFIF